MDKRDLRLFRKMPVLKTPRLVLRQMRVQDAEDVFAYASDPDTARFLLWSAHTDRSQTKRYLKSVCRAYRRKEFYTWAVTLREQGRMIGTCGFTSFDLRNNCGEIGYVLHRDYRGRGLATEAVLEVMRFGFETLGLSRIEGRYLAGNDASLRLMERCHMSREGVLRQSLRVKGSLRDVGICALCAQEYEALRRTPVLLREAVLH